MPKLSSKLYLDAGDIVASGRETFSCIAVSVSSQAVRGVTTPNWFCCERLFFAELFGIGRASNAFGGFASTFDELLGDETLSERGMKELRLMALALAHTLAKESNAGRFSL